jgi:thiamine phosphate synthase YjbQ (UPF0047 family)
MAVMMPVMVIASSRGVWWKSNTPGVPRNKHGRQSFGGRRLADVDSEVLDVDTARSRTVDLTDAVRAFCADRGDGLCSVFALERLLPRDDRYRHVHGSPGHGADHVLPAIVAPSVTVPVQAGTPLLGTWQSVVLVDLNRDNPRRSVRLSFLSC